MAPRFLLAAIVIAFALQAFYLTKRHEPYPALVMPAFGRCPETSDWPSFRLWSDRMMLREVSIPELMAPVDKTARFPIVYRHLREQSEDTSTWLLSLGIRIDPSTERVEIVW